MLRTNQKIVLVCNSTMHVVDTSKEVLIVVAACQLIVAKDKIEYPCRCWNNFVFVQETDGI